MFLGLNLFSFCLFLLQSFMSSIDSSQTAGAASGCSSGVGQQVSPPPQSPGVRVHAHRSLVNAGEFQH